MKKKNAPLNLLRIFDSAGKHLSFKKAADELFVTPPAVSYQVKTLEERLGFQLFIRNNRELKLTPEGEKYWAFIHKKILEIDEYTYKLQEESDKKCVRLSAVPPFAKRLIIPNLDEFQSLHPDIDLHVDSNIKNVGIEEYQADVVIRAGSGDWEDLVCEKLMDIEVQPIFPASFAERYDFSDIESFRSVPLVQMIIRPDGWKMWFEGNGYGTPTPSREYFVDDYFAAIEAAKTLGGAFALMPIENKSLDPELYTMPFAALPWPSETIYIVNRVEDKGTVEIQKVIDWIKALVQRHLASS